MIDKLGLDGLGGASVRVEPTPQGTNGVTGKADAGPAVVGLEPVAWYLENEDECMSEKLRKEHERLNSYTFKLCKVVHPLYSAADVAKLQAENEALRKDAERWRFFRIADWADWNAVFRVDHDGLSLPELLDKATDAAMKG